MNDSSTNRPILVGLTGAIGAGKSAVAAVWDSMGIPVLHSDDIARNLMESDAELRRSIEQICGPRAYANGVLDRQVVADCIFDDAEARRRVNEVVHPRTIAEQLRLAESLFEQGKRVVVVEAALIFESGGEDRFDYIVVVDANRSDRLQRAAERDGVGVADVERRDAAQMPAEKKCALADFVIRNDDSPEKLTANASFVGTLLLALPPRVDFESADDDEGVDMPDPE